MIYVCEYDDTTDSRILLEAAGCFLNDSSIFEIKEADRSGTRWKKLRERILAWLLLEYALVKEGKMWIKAEESCNPVDRAKHTECRYSAPVERMSCTGKKYGGYVKQLNLQRTEHGKPYSSRYPELFFNISHCDTACACVVADFPVGIDVERKFPYNENLKRHVCCEEEALLFDDLNCLSECRKSTGEEEVLQEAEMESDSIKEEQLQYLWSMKEAFVKMDGRGLGYGMKNVNLTELLPMDEEQWKCSRDGISFVVKTGTDYTLAVCKKDCVERETVIVLKEQDLVNRFCEKWLEQ